MFDVGTKEYDDLVNFLKAFEYDIAERFNRGDIRGPVHLTSGNEADLIKIFKEIRDRDWVCGTWRMHYHCLLKGVPPERLQADIIAGKSITLCYPEYRIVSSAIAGGILPIAMGIAASIQIRGEMARVWVFIGDMVAHSGMFAECTRYAAGHNLPIKFIVEDNGKSVCTPTSHAWGTYTFPLEMGIVRGYSYDLDFPHSGAGKRVEF